MATGNRTSKSLWLTLSIMKHASPCHILLYGKAAGSKLKKWNDIAKASAGTWASCVPEVALWHVPCNIQMMPRKHRYHKGSGCAVIGRCWEHTGCYLLSNITYKGHTSMLPRNSNHCQGDPTADMAWAHNLPRWKTVAGRTLILLGEKYFEAKINHKAMK